MKIIIKEEELNWTPHPLNEKVERKILLSKKIAHRYYMYASKDWEGVRNF